MALFQTVKRVTTEYVNQPVYPHPRPPKPNRSKKAVEWMQHLNLLCHNDPVHPLPVKMVPIGTAPDDTVAGGFRYIYACPFGRHNGHPCGLREYWVLTPNGPRQIWRGVYNGH